MTTNNSSKYLSPESAFSQRNSSENQRILDQFVHREVVCNLGQTMRMFAENNLDEFMETFTRYDYETAAEYAGWERDDENSIAYDEGRRFYNSRDDESSESETWEELCREHDIEAQEIEIYEFWSVSKFLFDELQSRGETVGDVLDFLVWGRCTTGQSIAQDAVIAHIAANMKIFHGQENDWSK